MNLTKKQIDKSKLRLSLLPPAEFNYAGPDWIPTIDCPKTLPRGAKYVATVEWAWSPAHSRQDSYHLSTNRSRTHWILWLGYIDEECWTAKWEHYPRAFCAKRGMPAKTAAFYLFLEGCRAERAQYDGSPEEPFHYVTGEGVLSSRELNLAAQHVWGNESQAPSPADIIQNIEKKSGSVVVRK
jgi:hypothetical protein